MPNATLLAALADPTAPFTDARYFEKDYAIRRGATKALFDVSNTDTTSNTGVFLNTAPLNNLVVSGTGATVAGPGSGTGFPAIVTGTLRSSGAHGFAAINLPGDNHFYIPASETKVLVTFYLRMLKTGFSAGYFPGLIGAGTGTGANTQWAFYVQDTGSDGTLDNATLRVRTPAGTNLDAALTGAALDALLDGDLHQVGLYMTRVADVGQCSIYVDGVLQIESSTSSMTAFNRPASSVAQAFTGPGLGYVCNPSGTNGLQDTRMGRFAVHYLTSSNLTVAEILADEAVAAALGSLA